MGERAALRLTRRLKVDLAIVVLDPTDNPIRLYNAHSHYNAF